MALQAQPSARAASIYDLDVLLYLRPHAQEQVKIWRAAGSRAAQSPHTQRLVHDLGVDEALIGKCSDSERTALLRTLSEIGQ